ncbi:MAG TPA: hypothetical protein VD838_12725, partial [Anaeromyxobacteraceae bacterium]|nr:hypothetical protein [Anaeromyxobacteraceae bacterium]
EWEREGAGATEVVVTRTLGFPPCPACAATARAEDDLDRGGEAAAVAELERLRARGLLGPAPRSSARSSDSVRPEPVEGRTGEPSLAPADRDDLRARFRCPECGGRTLRIGERLARHACPGGELRPVAWRGYDGALVELAWWRRERSP